MNTTALNTQIPHLNIQLLPDGLIRLENESMGDSYVVDIHPLQLRFMAEKLGMIGEVSASDAELLRTERGRAANLERDLGRYKRALLHINVRAEQLYDNIFRCSQRGHEDLSIEVAQSAALSDFAEHICIEFEDQFVASSEPEYYTHAREAVANQSEPPGSQGQLALKPA